MCAGNEAFYGFLFLYAHWPSTASLVLAALCAPVALAKTAISLVHLVEAAQEVARHDVETRRKAAR